MVDEFSTEGYLRHNRCRQEHLATLGLPLDGKTVLELGAGVGDHTRFWLDRGCTVTAVEGRAENVCRLQSRFPDLKVWLADLDDPTIRLPQHQIVYAYGILYHLEFPEEALARWAAVCLEMLLLETCVSPKLDFVLERAEEDRANPTASLRGKSCRPGREWLWIVLNRLFPYVYIPTTQPNHEEFPTEWLPLAQGAIQATGLLRSIFIGSRQPLQNPLLADHLLLSQGGGV